MYTLRTQDPETGLYRSYFVTDTTVWKCYESDTDDAMWVYYQFITGDTIVDDTLNFKKSYRVFDSYIHQNDGT